MKTRLHIITIVYNGMPMITWHLPVFNRLSEIDWTWHIVEGPAKNVSCTSWCKSLNPGPSTDGTVKYLSEIASHPRVKLYSKPLWNGKIEMVNAPVQNIRSGDYVLEVDADELWTSRQIETAIHILDTDEFNNACMFRCRYFLGPDLVIVSRNGYGNNPEYEWRRLWRAPDGFIFTRHEPPEVKHPVAYISHEEPESLGIVFDHYAYAFQSQVAFKEKYYGYTGAIEQWNRLQRHKEFPVDASTYLKWIETKTMVDRLTR